MPLRAAGSAGILAAALLLAACAGTRGPAEAVSEAAAPSAPAELRVIHLVHGDGEYTYHDASGRRLRADLEALRRARASAVAHPRGEAFLFHLRRGGSWFTSWDGRFEHYRGGRRIAEGAYTRGAGDTAFEAEAAIVRRSGESPRTHLAYYGHEIPLRDAPGYFPNAPRRPFSQTRFARALDAFASADSGKPFDVLVLSMCYGGNPDLIAALRPLARRVVASPAYLHLSYLDAGALAVPDEAFVADTVAARSFARLTGSIETEVTVAVYETGTVRPPPVGAPARADRPAWRDCAHAPGFDSATASAGTRLLYRAPRFGAGSDRARRSAWQCAF